MNMCDGGAIASSGLKRRRCAHADHIRAQRRQREARGGTRTLFKIVMRMADPATVPTLLHVVHFLTDTASCKSALSCIAGMQRENAALRQHVLDVWRASRKAGLDLNTTSFLPIPVRLHTYAICCVLAVFC